MSTELEQLKQAIDKQSALLEENNRILHKLRRYQAATFLFTMLWYALLIGLPFALYYYFIGPYIQALGFDTFNIREYPGYGQFETFFNLDKAER